MMLAAHLGKIRFLHRRSDPEPLGRSLRVHSLQLVPDGCLDVVGGMSLEVSAEAFEPPTSCPWFERYGLRSSPVAALG
jgi:hypothetical protein